MTYAYVCILIAALLPYLWVFIAKISKHYDNREPRAWAIAQENPHKRRAYSAHLNSFEAFAPFAASVLMAQFAGVDPMLISWFSGAFIVLRVLHGVCYITDMASLRSMSWFGGMACVVALMVMAAMQAAG